jgi:hypothetical protein
LGNYCFAGKALGVVPVEAAKCWASSLAELSGHCLWDMLFVMVAEGRLWLVGWDHFGLHWRHSFMFGSVAKGICGSLVGVLNVGWSVGTKGGMMELTAMAIASETCG